MPRVHRPGLPKKATNRIDPSVLRELLDDGKVHVQRALVVLEGQSHFEIVEGGADVLVDVELQPSQVRCTARLGGLGGGPGRGIWCIPPVGAEVVVLVPDGDLEAGPIIVGAESSGQVPDGLDGTTIVIVPAPGGKVLIHDGDASEAQQLATLGDLNNLADYIASDMVIACPAGNSTPGVLSTPPLPDANGTQTLRSK
jgi:hypothetical protein